MTTSVSTSTATRRAGIGQCLGWARRRAAPPLTGVLKSDPVEALSLRSIATSEVTFRGAQGQALAACLYLPRPAGARRCAPRTRDTACGSTSMRGEPRSESRFTAPALVRQLHRLNRLGSSLRAIAENPGKRAPPAGGTANPRCPPGDTHVGGQVAGQPPRSLRASAGSPVEELPEVLQALAHAGLEPADLHRQGRRGRPLSRISSTLAQDRDGTARGHRNTVSTSSFLWS